MATFAEFYKILEPIRHALGIFLNCLLIYCILRKSTQNIARYSFLLLNCALSDLMTCLFSLYVEPRLIRYLDGAYYICYGLSKYTGFRSSMVGYASLIMFYSHLNTSQLASFIYRWYILHYQPPSKLRVLTLIWVLASPNILLFSFCSLPLVLHNMEKDYREVVLQFHPEEASASIATFGIPQAYTDLNGSLPTFWLLYSVIPIIFIVFFIRWRILAFLKKHTAISEASKRMHKSLLRALTLQAFLPLLYLFSTMIRNLGTLKEFPLRIDTVFYEFALFFFCGFVPIIAPICSLYFVAPYRRFLASLFVKSKKENTVNIIVTTTTTNTA